MDAMVPRINYVIITVLAMGLCCCLSVSQAADYVVMKLPPDFDKASRKTNETPTSRSVLYKSKKRVGRPWSEQVNLTVIHPKLKLSAENALILMAQRFVHYCPASIVYPLHLYEERDYPMAMIGMVCLNTKTGTRGEVAMGKAMQTSGGTFILIAGHDAPVITKQNMEQLTHQFIVPVFHQLRDFLDATFICKRGMAKKECVPGSKVSVTHVEKINLHLGVQAEEQ